MTELQLAQEAGARRRDGVGRGRALRPRPVAEELAAPARDEAARSVVRERDGRLIAVEHRADPRDDRHRLLPAQPRDHRQRHEVPRRPDPVVVGGRCRTVLELPAIAELYQAAMGNDVVIGMAGLGLLAPWHGRPREHRDRRAEAGGDPQERHGRRTPAPPVGDAAERRRVLPLRRLRARPAAARRSERSVLRIRDSHQRRLATTGSGRGRTSVRWRAAGPRRPASRTRRTRSRRWSSTRGSAIIPEHRPAVRQLQADRRDRAPVLRVEPGDGRLRDRRRTTTSRCSHGSSTTRSARGGG